MQHESQTQAQPKNLPSHYLSEMLKKEMEKANKQPSDPGLPKK
jgi:hypothetical protein